MGGKQIRIGQLIAPFGPGSIYTDRRGVPHVVCGLDHWFHRYDDARGFLACEDISEFQRFEPRLAALLHVHQFRSPPDFRTVRRGDQAPPNALLTVPAVRFPSWYRHTTTGRMKKFNLDAGRIPPAQGGGRWQPVRFVSVCEGGHLNEFPWKAWIGCTCPNDDGLQLFDFGGSELSSIRVSCDSCPEGSPGRKGKSLSGTTVRPNPAEQKPTAFEKEAIRCPGERPWLGSEATEESCSYPLVAALINQTNIYFPRTVSAILLPDLAEADDEIVALRNEIINDPACGTVKTLWKIQKTFAVSVMRDSLGKRGMRVDDAVIERALENVFDNPAGASQQDIKPAAPESELLAFRRSEFNMLRRSINDPDHVPDLRVINAAVPADLGPWIAKVNLVERLRETRVFFGFDRLEPNRNPLPDMPESAAKQLFRSPPQDPLEMWLPAVEVFGEGIYIELAEEGIAAWQQQNAEWLGHRLDDGFLVRVQGVYQTLPPAGEINRDWASRYLLVHSLAHVLINQFVFECGYSTAALRERLFVSSDAVAPMASFMIYTAAGDAEGTLGGLVRLARPESLSPLIRRALARASWCSADPVCSEKMGGQGSQLANLAACHACILLPETSCETINHGLDRAMVVGTPDNRGVGFMFELISAFSW